MKIFSMKKTLLSLFLIAGVSFNSNAIEIGIGARLGFENEYSGMLTKTNKGTFNNVGWGTSGTSGVDGTLGAAMQMGVFADIILTEWFAVTPGLNISLFRGTTAKTTGYDLDGKKDGWSSESINFTAIDFDVLAKFMYGNWYGGVGLGMTFLTAPSYTVKNSEGMKIKSNEGSAGRISMNIVMDTGLYFPLMGSDNHHLITGIRTTYDIFALFAKGATVPQINDITESKSVGATPFTAAFTVGYMYKM